LEVLKLPVESFESMRSAARTAAAVARAARH
jgi:hypothetical protein